MHDLFLYSKQLIHAVAGQTFEADLRFWIDTTEALHALKDNALFTHAKIGCTGRTVDWIEDELDLGADNLRNPAIEQAGGGSCMLER